MESPQPSGQTPQLDIARALLNPRPSRDPAWPAISAAGFFAVCAMTFAVTAIMTPARYHAPIPVRSK